MLDYDDTLVRTRETRYKTLIRLARIRYGFELSPAEIDTAWGTPGDEFMRNLYGKYTSDFVELWDLYNQYCKDDPNEPHEGAAEFLGEFSAQLPVGILTSSSGKRVMPELQELGFSQSLFFLIQTAEDTPVHKPNPRVFSPLLSRMSQRAIRPDEILYVGDSAHDHAAAVGAGLGFIGMGHSAHTRQFFAAREIPFAATFGELTETIRGLMR